MPRCPECRATGFTPVGLKRHRARLHAIRPDHGTYARYQLPHSCRCPECRQANTDRRRADRKRITREG